MEEKENKIALYLIIIGIVLLIGAGVCYYFYSKDEPADNKNTINDKDNKNEKDYISIGDNKILRSDLDLTENAKVSSFKTDRKNGFTIANITEPDFQFETNYLVIYDKDGNKIMDVRKLKEKDNDNNKYKYNGKYDYDESKGILTFYTTLFLGESDESTGEAFDDKALSDLTKDEKKKLGDYSDVIKYEYKYEKDSFSLLNKKEVSKLKDNEYYKNVLN